jgi:choline-sulfatase
VSTPVGHVDLAATILDWAGLRQPSELRGHSLLPLISGKPEDHPGFAFSETHSEGNCTGSFMIRKGDWKFIQFTWYNDLLFNLKDDPDEMINLAGDKATLEIRQELKEILNRLIDTEEVTLRGFRTQDAMLKSWTKQYSENELFERFKGRLGNGQAMAMAKLAYDRFAS